MTRQNYILHNPASEIDLPRMGRTLPKNVLTAAEVEQVMLQPDSPIRWACATAPSWKRSTRPGCGAWS